MTQVFEGLLIGMAGLVAHKTRALLTMLGIIVGVAAVIAMLAIGNGAKEETRRQLDYYGATTLFVRAQRISGHVFQDAQVGLSVGLSVADGIYIKEAFPFVRGVAPEVVLEKKASYSGREPTCQVVGVGPEYFTLTRQTPNNGRVLMSQDVEENRHVCVVGSGVVRDLFLHEDAIGKTIRIGSIRFVVVGVLRPDAVATSSTESRGGTGEARSAVARIKSRDITRDVYIPISVSLTNYPELRRPGQGEVTSLNTPGYHRVREMIVQVSDVDQVVETGQLLLRTLKRRHAGTEDVEVIVPLEILDQSRKTQEIFNLVMALIAGLSLVVGGIGIMNIMLATVTERTREIGVRRAMGATRSDILIQFLMEATVISVTGGLLGIVLGISISQTVGFILGWPTLTSLFSIVLAFGVSAGVGIVFGLFPARVAAYKDPIAALRGE